METVGQTKAHTKIFWRIINPTALLSSGISVLENFLCLILGCHSLKLQGLVGGKEQNHPDFSRFELRESCVLDQGGLSQIPVTGKDSKKIQCDWEKWESKLKWRIQDKDLSFHMKGLISSVRLMRGAPLNQTPCYSAWNLGK